MTYIVDQKVIAESDMTDNTKGQLIMGVHDHSDSSFPNHANFVRIIGPDLVGHSLKVDSQELEQTMSEILTELKVMRFYLALGADEDLNPSDLEDL